MIDIETGSGVIRVQKSSFKGHDFIDVRKFYFDEESGELRPTKKGISISPDLVPQVLEAIKKLTL